MRKLLWGVCLSVFLGGQLLAAEPAAGTEQNKKEKPVADATAANLTIRGKAVEEAPIPEAEVDESVYLPEATTGVLKMPTKILETPATVQTVTPELIQDQDAFRLQDVLQNVAGVQGVKNESKGQEYETSMIRGFSQRLYRSGIRTLGTNTIDMNTVERIEIIKGANSVTYGDAEPGGIINVVTKGAHMTPYRTKLSTTFGSYDDYRAAIDTGGQITDDMAMRFNLSYTNKDSFRDYVDTESYSVAPAFLWQIGDTTTLDVRLSHKHEERMIDPGVYFDLNHDVVADIDTFLGDPSTDGVEIDDTLAEVTLTHEFQPWLTMRTAFVHHDLAVGLEAIRTKGNPDASNTVARRYDASDIRIKETALRNDFILTYDDCCVSNTLLFGVEARHVSKNWHSMQDNSLSRISITDPVYDLDTDSLNIVDNGDDDAETDGVAVYVQDKVALMDERLHLMFGLRYDEVKARNISTSDVKTKGDAEGVSGQIGGLYKLAPHFHPYVTISSSFNPQRVGRTDVDGNYIDPETGVQYEAGFKSPFFDDKFAMTASVYRIDKEDVAVADPDNDDYYINGGEMRSEGFELTFQGDFLPNWSIYASYAYTDTEVIESDSLIEGSAFQGVPLHSGSIWIVHTHREGPLAGLRLGGGIFAADERAGDDDNTFDIPGYVTVDMMAGYKKELCDGRIFSTQLNIKNVLDKEYYETGSGYSMMPGAGRTATLTFGFEF